MLRAKDYDDQEKQVTRLGTEEAYETLGVFLAPTGDHSVEYKHLLNKANQWADRLRTAPLCDYEAAMALKATILKTLEYPLPAIFLSDQECNKLMSIVLTAALPKARFNRNSCRRTMYGPGSHGGQEIANLKTSQLLAHADIIMRHGPAPTVSGQQFRATIQAAKLELGLPGALFSQEYKTFGHLLTDCWMKQAWREFDTAGLEVHEQTDNLRLQRVGDIYLMQAFSQHGFRNTKLLRLNKCRIRLQVVTQADITSGDGRYILPEALTEGFQGINAEYEWPNQGPLPPSYWRLWRRAILKVFHSRRDGILSKPLGRWLPNGRTKPQAVHDPSAAITYIRQQQSWLQYQHLPRQLQMAPTYEFLGATDQPPPDAHPAVAWLTDGELQFRGSAPKQVQTTVRPQTLEAAIDTLEDEWCWAIEHIEWNVDPSSIANEIKAGTARAITDGSFKAQKGTAGFAIVDHTCKQGIYCMHRTPGPEYSQCSYRSENGGIVGILLVLKLLDDTYSLDTGDLVIGCDNIESGKHCLQYTGPLAPTTDHYDILAAAYELRSKLPLQPRYLHVEGHQRTKHPKRQLDQWATLNEDMDALAKAYWRHTAHMERPSLCKPREWIVSFQGMRIITKFNSRLRKAIEGQRLEDKWTSPSGTKSYPQGPSMTRQQLKSIDLYTSQLAWDSETTQRRRFVTKFTSRQLPTGRRMRQFQFWNASNCPLCNTENETTEHVFLCPDTRARAFRRNAIATFEQELKQLHTATDIRQCMIMLIRARLLHKPLLRHVATRDEVRQLIGRQLWIHPLALLQGRLCKGWKEAQQQAFQNYSPWRSGQTWATATIKALWQLAFSIWEYRNSILHETQENHPDVDTDAIDLNILEEWTMGPATNWDNASRSLFRGITCDELLAKPIHHRMQWLYYVRLARTPNNLHPR